MEPHYVQLALQVGAILAAGAGGFAGVKITLNGARADITEIKQTVNRIDGQVQQNRVDISGIRSRCVAFHGERDA